MSTEVEDFVQEYKIDADASFGDLHRLILRNCKYQEIAGQRFFICDSDWHPNVRILLTDEDQVNIDEDVYLMEDTDLGEFLEDEGQRLAYRYDPENKRMFLLELTETLFGEEVNREGLMTRSSGNPPQQITEEEMPVVNSQVEVTEELDEEFYGEDGFNDDEFDEEGFDLTEE